MYSNISCFKEHFGPYEKAVYASLAGFVSPVLPVCKTYMDFIWAYFKGLYNKIIDRELRYDYIRLIVIISFSNFYPCEGNE